MHIWINHKKENYFVLKTGRGDLKTFEWTKVDPDEEREGDAFIFIFILVLLSFKIYQ